MNSTINQSRTLAHLTALKKIQRTALVTSVMDQVPDSAQLGQKKQRKTQCLRHSCHANGFQRLPSDCRQNLDGRITFAVTNSQNRCCDWLLKIGATGFEPAT